MVLDIYYTRERIVAALYLIIITLPFTLLLAYESITNRDWITRHYSRITLACFLATITALAI